MVFPIRLALTGATLLALLLIPGPARAGELEDELGRSESRVRSAPFPLLPGRTVWDYALDERLERLGYRRVRRRYYDYVAAQRAEVEAMLARLPALRASRADAVPLE